MLIDAVMQHGRLCDDVDVSVRDKIFANGGVRLKTSKAVSESVYLSPYFVGLEEAFVVGAVVMRRNGIVGLWITTDT